MNLSREKYLILKVRKQYFKLFENSITFECVLGKIPR